MGHATNLPCCSLQEMDASCRPTHFHPLARTPLLASTMFSSNLLSSKKRRRSSADPPPTPPPPLRLGSSGTSSFPSAPPLASPPLASLDTPAAQYGPISTGHSYPLAQQVPAAGIMFPNRPIPSHQTHAIPIVSTVHPSEPAPAPKDSIPSLISGFKVSQGTLRLRKSMLSDVALSVVASQRLAESASPG